MPSQPHPHAFLPLRPLELLVLAMVADAPLHGYGIRQAILDHTGGSIEVEAGNLYRHVRRLHAESLIEITRRRGADEEGERRRYFRITAFGRRVLTAELERLRQLVKYAEERRLLAPGTS